MTREEAIEIFKLLRQQDTRVDADEYEQALDMAISALERIGYLKDRPCSVCEFNKENGCCKWTCVFCDKLFGSMRGAE